MKPELALEHRRVRWIRLRMAILAFLVLLGAGAVVRRAIELSVEHGSALSALADEQQLRTIRLAPKRGTIYDRHGAELAVSVEVESIYANPRMMRARSVDPAQAAQELARVLGVDAERLERRFRSDRFFVWVKRQVSPTEATAVRALGIDGVQMTDEARRFYPNRELAGHVLGFANIDGEGIEGLELEMEERLRGRTDRVPAVRDGAGHVVFSEQLLDSRSTQGDDVYLTIDKTIQFIAERELALAVRTSEARAGSLVVMDPRSGEILAMANYPTFNPNHPGAFPASHRRNRAVTDRFEPGSTLKPFTIVAALASGVIRPDQSLDCSGEDGFLYIGDDRIRDTHRFGELTPAGVLSHSSNICAALIGQRLGSRRLYRALRRFGFGERTGIPLPGETAGILRHHTAWYELDLATIAFGQGMSLTALQLASATSALANGGRLMQPRLIRRVENGRGEVVEERHPEPARQVVMASSARLVADMMTGVTGDGGTGTEAAVSGYLVAGKTGTAQKADYVHGGYAEGLYTASFIGFVPARSPRLAMAVVIDEPVVDHYGGSVAAPVFRRVAEASLHHLGVVANGGGAVLTELEREHRRRTRRQRGGESGVESEAVSVQPVAIRPTGDTDEQAVPDVHGLTVRRAFHILRSAGFSVRLRGSGLVASQEPSPGARVEPGSVIRLVLRPEPASESAVAPSIAFGGDVVEVRPSPPSPAPNSDSAPPTERTPALPNSPRNATPMPQSPDARRRPARPLAPRGGVRSAP